MRFRVVQPNCPEWSGRVGFPQAPRTLNLQPESVPRTLNPQHVSLSRSLAQHFGIEVAMVEDILIALSANGRLTLHELEEQAMVTLSGMCDDSESSSEEGSDTDMPDAMTLKHRHRRQRSVHTHRRWQFDKRRRYGSNRRSR